MKKVISCLIVLLGANLTVNAQNVDLTNGVDYIRLQSAGQTGFTRAFGLNPFNELYIGSVEQTIGNMYFFNKGTGYLMTLTPNGNVGIGTTAPGHSLQIHNSDTPTIAIGQSVRDTNGKSALRFYAGTSTSLWNGYRVQYNKDNTTDRLSFIDGGNVESLSLLNGGNIGIGTITPTEKLQVNGNQSILDGNLVFNNSLTNQPETGTLRWNEYANNTNKGGAYIKYDGAANYLQVFTNTETVNNEHMRIYRGGAISLQPTSGNVGIGTTAPSVKLDVRESSPDGVINKIAMATRMSTVNSTDVASYDTSFFGSILGFGMAENKTDSGYKVAVNASAYSNYSNFAGTLNANYGLWARAGINVGAAGAKINDAVGVYAELLTTAANTTITNGYGVKINTNGTGAANVINRYDLYAGTAEAKNYFAGNVGIGTTAPDAKLTINDGTQLVNFLVNKKLTGAWPAVTENATVTMQSSGTIAGNLAFATGNSERMRVTANGNVGIGTTTTGNHKLAVEGSIGAREVKVEASGWSDFVFEKEYSLPTLKEVAQHIQEKGHLKDIPSAKEVEKNGFFLGEMDSKLLQKIEELTLYTIAQEKKISTANAKIAQLETEKTALKKLSQLVFKLQAKIEKIENTKK